MLEALYACMKQSGQHDDGLIALDFREQNTNADRLSMKPVYKIVANVNKTHVWHNPPVPPTLSFQGLDVEEACPGILAIMIGGILDMAEAFVILV